MYHSLEYRRRFFVTVVGLNYHVVDCNSGDSRILFWYETRQLSSQCASHLQAGVQTFRRGSPQYIIMPNGSLSVWLLQDSTIEAPL